VTQRLHGQNVQNKYDEECAGGKRNTADNTTLRQLTHWHVKIANSIEMKM